MLFACAVGILASCAKPTEDLTLVCKGTETVEGKSDGEVLAPESRSITRTFRFFQAERQPKTDYYAVLAKDPKQSVTPKEPSKKAVWIMQEDNGIENYEESSIVSAKGLASDNTKTTNIFVNVDEHLFSVSYSYKFDCCVDANSGKKTKEGSLNRFNLSIDRNSGHFEEVTNENSEITNSSYTVKASGSCEKSSPKF